MNVNYEEIIMKETVVTICSGTLCYVMGGAALLSLKDHIREDLRDSVIVKASPCLGYCKDPAQGKPPFVEVNGEKIAQADVSAILSKIIRG